CATDALGSGIDHW
nr:immunoglobulin heavy chain junction region [Macaca mulatta]MOX91505.1 immunoglobulin heavy chain junction region [Macaca mulatta]MOX91558.1 immunoglobulin heavy chain junction region [Macaca mulatta]MOX91607.1 immunoglobulin heavy chain junction region [Macaca mulatta]MOX91670.1 immunoglobulin heavy chain junction region [Macaca mulatta]